MSNIGNIFGNEGWIQSSIDRSRGKTRPGAKRRGLAKKNKNQRRKLLENDPLVQKAGGLPADHWTKVGKKKVSIGGLGGLIRKQLLIANDPLLKKHKPSG